MPVKLDHVGLNTIIQEPVTASTNTIGFELGENSGSYINTEVVAISPSNFLVSLNIHRNGPYNWPIFKQTRIGQNPLTRYQIRNSIFTYVTEIGEVKMMTQDGNFLSATRNRRSELRSFIETPVVSNNKPLLLIGSTENESDNETDADERVQVEVSFANETTYFTNELANKEHDLDDELDEAYEEFVDLYLDGGLDSDDSPFDQFELLQYSQTIYPRSVNSYSENIRNRPTFESGYWKDSIDDRTTIGVDNGFGFTVSAQSIWPLDVESDWKTRALGATFGYFTASAPLSWNWHKSNESNASGLSFSSGSNKIVSMFSQSVAPGSPSTFISTELGTRQLTAEKGSLNSIEGTIRFWDAIESAMLDVGLRFIEGQTTFRTGSARLVSGPAYKVPSLDDPEYELKLNATGSNQTRFRQIFSSSMTVSWREIGAFTVDSLGRNITGEGTYIHIVDSTYGTNVKLRKNSGEEFQAEVSNNYDSYDYNGAGSTYYGKGNSVAAGGTKVIFDIDKEQTTWRGWSSISLEVPNMEPPALLVNGISQSADVQNNFQAYGEGVYLTTSIDSGPNYNYDSNFTTGSYGWRINPSTTHNHIFHKTGSSLIHTSARHTKLAHVITLNLGDKPTNTEGEGYSIYSISGSGDQRFSLVHFATSSREYHSSLAAISLQADQTVPNNFNHIPNSGSSQPPTGGVDFAKIIWNIPLERANKTTKFYLYSDFENITGSGWYHNDIGITASMDVATTGSLQGAAISSSFDVLRLISKDENILESPAFLDTNVAICDLAILSGSDLIGQDKVTRFLHSGSVLNFTSSYMSSHSGLVYRWWDFGGGNVTSQGATSTPRVGGSGSLGYYDVGDNNGNVITIQDNQTVSVGNRLAITASNKAGALSLDTGLPTKFLDYSGFTAENASGGSIWILSDQSGFSNLVSSGDNRITEFSLIGHVDRGATEFYAQTGSNLYKWLGMTSSAISSVYPYSTASILFRFHSRSSSDFYIVKDIGAQIPNLGSGGSGSLPNVLDTDFGIYSSFLGSIKPIEESVGSLGAEGMISASLSTQGFEYRVANITQQGLRDNTLSYPVLGQIKDSLISPTEDDYFIGGSNGFANQKGGGILVNSYNTFNRNEYTSSLTVDQQFSASCLYTRRHTLLTASSFYNPFGLSFSASNDDSQFNRDKLNKFELYQGMAFWDAPAQSGRKPFFNSYSEFSENPKLAGKDYSIIPEFKISDHVDKYLVSGETSFGDEDTPLFKIDGGKVGISNSDDDTFYETYSTTEFLKNFDIIQGDNEGFVDPFSLTLRCKAIKKLLPYKGFYPADRTVEIAQQFYSSYGENISFTSDEAADVTSNYAVQNLLTPLFSPGILFNTIKSGVACDYPLVTTKLKTNSLSDLTNGTTGSHFINQQFDTRIPFEALIEPEKYLANIELISNEPDPLAAPSLDVIWNGQGDEKYRLMASNFLAEVGEFYLQNENYSTITSLPQGDPNFGNAKKDLTYSMRLKMYRSISGQKDIYRDIAPRNAFSWTRRLASQITGSAALVTAQPGLNGYLKPSDGVSIIFGFWLRIEGVSDTLSDGQEDMRAILQIRDKTGTGTGIHQNGNEIFGIFVENSGDDLSNIYTVAMSGDWSAQHQVTRYGTAGDDIPSHTWNHIVVVQKLDSVKTPPQVYINGVDIGEHDSASYLGGSDAALSDFDILSIGDSRDSHVVDGNAPAYGGNLSGLNGSLQDLVIFSGTEYTDSYNDYIATLLYNDGKRLDPRKYIMRTIPNDPNSSNPLRDRLKAWWLLGEEKFAPDTSGSLALDSITRSVPPFLFNVGGRLTLQQSSSVCLENIKITDGVGFGDTDLSRYSSPKPQGFFAIPQDTGSMTESITMYSRPSGFGPPQRLILSGSSKYKIKFNNWESFKKGNNHSVFYDTSDTVFLESNVASSDPTFKDLEYCNTGSGFFVKGNDALEGYNYPFTPPYYHGEAWADITFKPTESKKYTLSEIINSSSVEFLRYYKPHITSSEGETTNWRLVNEDAMQLASSVNIFSRGILPGTNTTDLDIANSYRWIVQSKFETPILDFNDIAFQEDQAGVDADKSISIPNIAPETTPIGMWHQYGRIPQQPDKGIFLQITDVPRRWTENAVSGSFVATSSLADLCGFSTDPVRMGELSSIKEVSEAIVAIPYVEVDGDRQFLKISKRDIKHALDPKLRHLVGQSLIDMTNRMKKFVLPPSMDFVKNKEIEPFAMYIFEFTHSFTREDLSNMWQNLQPDISISHEVDEVEISHELLFHELLGGKARIKPAPGSDNEIGAVLDRQARLSEINPSLKWMVFKAKQRAKNNYFEKIFARNESNSNGGSENNVDTNVAKKLNIGFNWPYDFFSLVELGKIEADIVFANVDDENQEEKTVIKPRIKASRALPKTKENDSVINNSLFGTGEDQPDEDTPVSEKSKVKANPLGKLNRRRRKR